MVNSSIGGSGLTARELAEFINAEVRGDGSIQISGVSHDSSSIQPGDLFAALPGRKTHGSHFVESAIAQGASSVLTDLLGAERCQQLCERHQLALLVVDSPRKSLGAVCSRVYGQPPMKLVGITGTNGKTTTAYMVMQGAREIGLTTGMIGTLATYIGDSELESARTTPEAPEIFKLLLRMYEKGCELVVMEVSSIAIAEHRIDGLLFDVVGFTNLSHDHLDYHGTMDSYFDAKCELFTPDHAIKGVACIDDLWGRALMKCASIPMQSASIVFEALNRAEPADWFGIRESPNLLEIHDPSGERYTCPIQSPGAANAANALMAIALLGNLGYSVPTINKGVCESSVPGRGELVCTHNEVPIYVDYAHSPAAIESFLSGLREQAPGRLIVVIGAGGDRDGSKRGTMGEVAAQLAHTVIVTDDNPRSEDPSVIRQAIVEGALKFPDTHIENIAGRREAIKRAIEIAMPGDRIAILGKGHESTIEIMGKTIPFKDSEVVLELVRRV